MTPEQRLPVSDAMLLEGRIYLNGEWWKKSEIMGVKALSERPNRARLKEINFDEYPILSGMLK